MISELDWPNRQKASSEEIKNYLNTYKLIEKELKVS